MIKSRCNLAILNYYANLKLLVKKNFWVFFLVFPASKLVGTSVQTCIFCQFRLGIFNEIATPAHIFHKTYIYFMKCYGIRRIYIYIRPCYAYHKSIHAFHGNICKQLPTKKSRHSIYVYL